MFTLLCCFLPLYVKSWLLNSKFEFDFEDFNACLLILDQVCVHVYDLILWF